MVWSEGESDALLGRYADIITFRIDPDRRLLGMAGPGLGVIGLESEPFADSHGSESDARAFFDETEPQGALAHGCARAFAGDQTQLQVRWRGERFAVKLIPTTEQDGVVRFVDGLCTLIPNARLDDHSNAGLLSLMQNVAGMAYRCKNDEAWTMELVSDGCLALTGYTVSDLRDNNKLAFGDLVHPDDTDWLWKKCQTNLDARRFCSNQYRIRHADGEIRWVWDRAQGVYDDNGELRFIEGLVTDVTAEKRAQAAHESLTEQLHRSQKMAAVGQLAGGIAHDFNNLLAAIGLNLNMCGRDAGEHKGETWRLCLTEAMKAVDRAAAVTQQLLAIGRRIPTKMSTIDVNLLLSEHALFIGQLLPASITVTVEPGDVDNFEADSTQVQQVLVNLCLNARDAMPDGGSLTIRTKYREFDAEFVKASAWAKEGSFVCITVQDTGTGMSEEVVRRIFEPFFTTKPAGEGTGLGLAMSQSILDEHGGFIRVDSEVDSGTSIHLYFPVAQVDAIHATPDEITEAPVLVGDETVLVVEDRRDVLDSVVRLLSSVGYRVLTANNGIEGIGMVVANADTIKLVLMDVVMPGMSGSEAAGRIHQLHPSLRILFTTGHGGDAVNRDEYDVLQKPYSPEQLLRRVRVLLDS